MDINIEKVIEVLTNNSELLKSSNYEELFKKINPALRAHVYQFLIEELSIDPLPEMDTIPSNMFTYYHTPKLVLPDNIKILEAEAFKACEIDKIKIGDGVRQIPSKCFASSSTTQVFLPESVIKIASGAFDSSDIQMIVTPWRESRREKLSIPSNETDFYKEHLRFQHKPKDEPVIDGTNQGEDA